MTDSKGQDRRLLYSFELIISIYLQPIVDNYIYTNLISITLNNNNRSISNVKLQNLLYKQYIILNSLGVVLHLSSHYYLELRLISLMLACVYPVWIASI